MLDVQDASEVVAFEPRSIQMPDIRDIDVGCLDAVCLSMSRLDGQHSIGCPTSSCVMSGMSPKLSQIAIQMSDVQDVSVTPTWIHSISSM